MEDADPIKAVTDEPTVADTATSPAPATEPPRKTIRVAGVPLDLTREEAEGIESYLHEFDQREDRYLRLLEELHGRSTPSPTSTATAAPAGPRRPDYTLLQSDPDRYYNDLDAYDEARWQQRVDELRAEQRQLFDSWTAQQHQQNTQRAALDRVLRNNPGLEDYVDLMDGIWLSTPNRQRLEHDARTGRKTWDEIFEPLAERTIERIQRISDSGKSLGRPPQVEGAAGAGARPAKPAAESERVISITDQLREMQRRKRGGHAA